MKKRKEGTSSAKVSTPQQGQYLFSTAEKDSVFLVTGSSSGLGEATVDRLLELQGIVVGLDVQENNKHVLETYHNRFVFIRGDVTSEKDVLDALELTKSKYGRLDGVVNCAGIIGISPVYNFQTNTPISLEEFNRVIQVNLMGTINVIRLAVGLIKENEKPNEDEERGVIINTGSIAGLDGMMTAASYVASKAAINGLTLNLARDLAEKKIRVVTIAPGFYTTAMTKPFEYVDGKIDEVAYVFPKKSGKPETFAKMVEAIVENVMLNGSVIRLDGAQRFGYHVGGYKTNSK